MNRMMNKFAIAFMAGALLAFVPPAAWKINTKKAKVSFELPNEGTAGTIGGLKADIRFDPKDPGASKITASVEVRTISTGDKGKDKHLQAPDFFYAEKFPIIKFTSTRIAASEKGYIATGTIAIRDSVKTIELPFTFQGSNKAAVFQGSFEVYCGDFGVMKKSATGGDKVIVKVEVPVSK